LIKFTEEKLEQAVIELFGAEGYKHLTADQIYKEMADASMQHHFKDAIP
jgi:hypothetical protein